MGEIKMEPTPKKFKFKIRIEAVRNEGIITGEMTFEQAANDWYNTIGKPSLMNYFKEKQVNDYSYLNRFSFGDSVDKETYD